MYARIGDDPVDLAELSDAELIRWVKLGDEEALETLLERHSDALLRFCYQLTGNREDAEDICQESMARVLTRVDTLQTGAAFRTWLFRIAKNLSVDTFRRRKKLCPLPEDDLTPEPLQADGPHVGIEEAEELRTVTAALGDLAESHQSVLVLREVEGLSYADIAHRLNVSQSAVETLLFRARRRLREQYAKRLAPVPAVALLGGLRDIAIRLATPLAGGPPLAAKVAVTVAVVGGVVAAPRVAPVHHLIQILPRAVPLTSTHHLARHATAMSHPHQGTTTRLQATGRSIALSTLQSHMPAVEPQHARIHAITPARPAGRIQHQHRTAITTQTSRPDAGQGHRHHHRVKVQESVAPVAPSTSSPVTGQPSTGGTTSDPIPAAQAPAQTAAQAPAGRPRQSDRGGLAGDKSRASTQPAPISAPSVTIVPPTGASPPPASAGRTRGGTEIPGPKAPAPSPPVPQSPPPVSAPAAPAVPPPAQSGRPGPGSAPTQPGSQLVPPPGQVPASPPAGRGAPPGNQPPGAAPNTGTPGSQIPGQGVYPWQGRGGPPGAPSDNPGGPRP